MITVVRFKTMEVKHPALNNAKAHGIVPMYFRAHGREAEEVDDWIE